MCQKYNSKFHIAYNRRFYPSVLKAKSIIDKDGGLISISFDFTEWEKSVNETNLPDSLNERWGLLNSLHIIDTCFYVAGIPKLEQINSLHHSGLAWHKSSRIFFGHGFTSKGIPFSYQSDWGSAGRWSIQLNTSKRAIHLKPIECCSYVLKETINSIEIPLPSDEFKPGFFNQTQSFISNQYLELCSLEEAFMLHKAACKIFNYVA